MSDHLTVAQRLAFFKKLEQNSSPPVPQRAPIKINSSSNLKFHSLKLPKLNMLVKQGERPNYKKLDGMEVEVISIENTILTNCIFR